ncbi:MAG: outer membrane lipoprotein chaperone LolA [Gammaproteobacteria bacterium]|nr:outer membrane lipoprotein chaperone LolA [Gammaproteobacteria bacterium]
MRHTLPRTYHHLVVKPLLTALAVAVGSFATLAQADGQAEAAAELNRLLSKAETLSADFSQMTRSANGTNLQETKGEVTLQRPGKFVWHTAPPLEQVLVSDGEQIWLYDPDLMQVTVQQMDPRLTHTPALLLSGDVSTLAENFEIYLEDSGSVMDFTLTPKASDTMFEELRLSFWDGRINDMQLNDPIGQRTNILFSNVQINPEIDADMFTFDIPDGVDVISE